MKIGVAALCGTPTFMSLHVGAAARAMPGTTSSPATATTGVHPLHVDTRGRCHARKAVVNPRSGRPHMRPPDLADERWSTENDIMRTVRHVLIAAVAVGA